jgi:hypothetical protein
MTKVAIVNFNPVLQTDFTRTGYVQIDFMPGEDIAWLKTYYHSPSNVESNFKGAHRNILLAIIAKNTDLSKISDTIIERYMLSPIDGLVRIRRISNGNKFTNTIISPKLKSPEAIVATLGLLSINTLNSFESLWNAMTATRTDYEISVIANEFANDRTMIAKGIPKVVTDNIEEYWYESNTNTRIK